MVAGMWKRMGGEIGQQNLCMHSELIFLPCCKLWLIFNLEGYYFLSFSGGTLSLHHSFLHFLLDVCRKIWISSHHHLVLFPLRKCELILMWTYVDGAWASLDLKKIARNMEQVWLLATVQEWIPCALEDLTRILERLAGIKPKNSN